MDRILCQNLFQNISKIYQQRSVGGLRYLSSKVDIPKKKARDELSILRALASTTKQDPNAPNFRYIDDPFLIPNSQLEKRVYSLAKSSGQKAAHYVLENYKEFVKYRPLHDFTIVLPQVYECKFKPPIPENTIDCLQDRIAMRQVALACQSYDALKNKNVDVPKQVKLDLLQLCCFYNSEDPVVSPYEEEVFFEREINRDKLSKSRKTWKDNGYAEKLFSEIGTSDKDACASMVKGRAKYFDVDKAYELFKEMEEKKMSPCIEVYNSVLRVASFLHESPIQRFQLVEGLLKDIKSNGLRPTLTTFNNILHMIHRSSKHDLAPKQCMRVIKEMKSSGIEPSLGSWALVLRTYYDRDVSTTSNILNEILDYLKNKEFDLQSEFDLDFFVTAMSVNFNNFQDLQAAHKIDALLHTGNNISLLGDAHNEGVYYTNYLRILCMFEQINTIMAAYSRITPHLYTPSFGAYEDLLTAVELNDGFQYVPHIWSDFVLFQYARRKDLVEKILHMMAKKKMDDCLQLLYQKIAEDIVTMYKADSENLALRKPFELSGTMIGYLAKIFLNSTQTNMAWDVFNIFTHNRNTIHGFPSEDSLVLLANCAVDTQDFEKYTATIGVMSDIAYPKLKEVVAKGKEVFSAPDQIHKIKQILD